MMIVYKMKKETNKIVKIPMEGLTAIEELNALKKKLGITNMSFTVNPEKEVSSEQVAKDAVAMLNALLNGDFKDISNEKL